MKLTKILNSFISQQNIVFFILFALTLGLAPFSPPHIVEKLGMLVNGTLSKPIDIFDFCYHGLPWVLLIYKLTLMIKNKNEKKNNEIQS